MSTIYLVSGGARSGKSGYAQSLCEYLSPDPIYLATSEILDNDKDFAKRVLKHQQDRGDEWTTIEEPLEPSKHLDKMKGRVVLVDCCTLWLTNYMMKEGLFSLEKEDVSDKAKDEGLVQDASERAVKKVEKEFDKLTKPWNCTFVIVTNELGSGTHAHDHTTRKFVDAQGWFNQYVAKRAEVVVHMVCGCPNIIKGSLSASSLSNAVRGSAGLALPTLEEAQKADMLDCYLSKRDLTMDPKGYFKFKIDEEKKVIFASYHSCIVNEEGEFFDLEGNKLTCHGRSPEPLKIWACRTAKELTTQILEQWEMAEKVLTISHGGYIGREAQKAEAALYSGKAYQQD